MAHSTKTTAVELFSPMHRSCTKLNYKIKRVVLLRVCLSRVIVGHPTPLADNIRDFGLNQLSKRHAYSSRVVLGTLTLFIHKGLYTPRSFSMSVFTVAP